MSAMIGRKLIIVIQAAFVFWHATAATKSKNQPVHSRTSRTDCQSSTVLTFIRLKEPDCA
jgi:hypothetical protein